MSGVKVIRSKLVALSALTSIVSASRIMAGTLPQGVQLPAISILFISGTPRNTISMNEAKKLYTDRIQVSAAVKIPNATPPTALPAGQGYPTIEAIMPLLRQACANASGTIAGMDVDSILPDLEGPDLADMAVGMLTRSQDFIVKYRA